MKAHAWLSTQGFSSLLSQLKYSSVAVDELRIICNIDVFPHVDARNSNTTMLVLHSGKIVQRVFG